MTRIRATLVTIAIAFAMAIGASAAGSAPAGSAPGEESGDPQFGPADRIVVLGPGGFDPPYLEVTAGSTVTWVHRDPGSLHTVTDSGGGFESHPWCTRTLPTSANCMGEGDRFAYDFEHAGTFFYSSRVHPSFTGEIVVVPSEPTTTTSVEDDEERDRPERLERSGEGGDDAVNPAPPDVAGPPPPLGTARGSAHELDQAPSTPTTPEGVPPEGEPQAADAGLGVDAAGATGVVLFLLAAGGGGAALLWRFRPSTWEEPDEGRQGTTWLDDPNHFADPRGWDSSPRDRRSPPDWR
ncbi:MAG TPA: hypothetical protein VM618_07665 [Acidimicrobiia bacterium]|nr:hypothetical protein [Acidimicrobiia bacterium]